MQSGLILAGEPMGLLIAQSEGALGSVTGYDLAVAGAEFNVAVGVARLGHRVTYLTKLGCDPFGERIIHVLHENKIGTELVTWSNKRRTGFMLKGRVREGDPPIFYFRAGSAASTLAPADVRAVDFSVYSHIHLTGILPALTDSTRAAVLLMIENARAAGLTISFDPNLRPQLWQDARTMRETVNDLAARADIVLPGTEEGKLLMGSDDPDEIASFYQERGAKIVITKCGSAGAFVADGETRYHVAGFRVRKVIDTVGAGDGFAAGIITGLMEGLPLEDTVRRAAAIGAIQVMSRGDNEGLPTRAALEIFMKEADSADA